MAINPFRKGGNDTIPISEGGTGATDAASALSNMGGLDAPAHALIDHAAIPGAGGAWQLVEKIEVTVATSTVDFTGLDGNADGYYYLVSTILPASAVAVIYYVNPNGLTTNQSTDVITLGAAYSHGTDPRLRIGFAVSGFPSHINYSTTHIRAAHTGPGGANGLRRQFTTDNMIGNQRFIYSGIWTDGAVNITSLQISSTIANEIDAGSTFILYKLVSA